jgi:hypothetical protein
MKQSEAIFLFLIGLVLFSLFRKPVKKTIDMALSRGYRNNNPGNIVLTPGSFWRGEIAGTDKRFKTFESMEYGYRGIFVTLNSYIRKGFDTIEKIINRYAPPHENQTLSYAKTVSNMTGISLTTPVSFQNPEEIIKIVAAISFVENGIQADLEQILKGYQLFKS